jgi:hypothetical protein
MPSYKHQTNHSFQKKIPKTPLPLYTCPGFVITGKAPPPVILKELKDIGVGERQGIAPASLIPFARLRSD